MFCHVSRCVNIAQQTYMLSDDNIGVVNLMPYHSVYVEWSTLVACLTSQG